MTSISASQKAETICPLFKIMKGSNPDELVRNIARAINEVICSDYGFDEEFDWSLLYFIAKPALNFI